MMEFSIDLTVNMSSILFTEPAYPAGRKAYLAKRSHGGLISALLAKRSRCRVLT